MKYNAKIKLKYKNGTEINYNVTVDNKNQSIIRSLMIITRGTLMESNAQKATCYNTDGYIICEFIK